MIRLLAAAIALAAMPAAAETVDQVAARYGLAGEILVAKGDRVLLDRGYGTIDPAGGPMHKAGERWRLASITKQVTAALIVRDHARDLDRSLPGTGGAQAGSVTMRQLLTHHSGLANPDTTPAQDGVPAFYRASTPDLAYCRSRPPQAGAPFSYNNCDYLLAAAALYPSGAPAWPKGMAMARGDEKGVPGFIGGKPEPRFALASWGAAGGLTGTARAVLNFDRALMTNRLLAPDSLAALWQPEGGGSYQALGQWVFPGKLKGCATPKRIVQRDGEIYGVQARNFILPDDDLVVIVFTNRSSDDFALGEVWEGKGFVYDLLSAAACS
ncbi:hypothetical protein GCM10011380_06870 [Sphingomonas metalli]|uniref:Beta-lactamase-related domain-containing protein n=1 Tax=Sphingomonas metalli TaxID=1779358 RepID=A0A916SYH7_9SPHN|nr:serine hydrolase domain-containing protein [Sphingomonas metalli]GGB19937.1 hypothetical protein GCM10011380_06870 [Sphingomonas metalli]